MLTNEIQMPSSPRWDSGNMHVPTKVRGSSDA